VLDIAPLIMVTLPTVSSFFSTCGCFLRGGRSPSGNLPPLSLALGWPPSTNGSLLCEWRHLQGFRIEDPRVQGKGGRTDPQSGLGRPAWADRPRPTSARFGRPFTPVGPHAFMLCPFHLHDFDNVILASKMEVSVHEVRSFTLQSPGCSFITLRSSPPLKMISSSS
jgi:hypothetical protein